jgi:hypothetical protein
MKTSILRLTFVEWNTEKASYKENSLPYKLVLALYQDEPYMFSVREAMCIYAQCYYNRMVGFSYMTGSRITHMYFNAGRTEQCSVRKENTC